MGGSELELIEEEEPLQIDEPENQEEQIVLPISTPAMRLPPIFENQGFKLSKRDFSKPKKETELKINEAGDYRYIRSNRNRKLSM